MSADAMSYGGQGFSGVEPSPLFFPDDAARRRLRTSCALGIGALIVLVGGFILTEVVAAGVGAHHGADGGLGMLAGLLLTPVPLAMYSLILSVRSLRSRFGMRVDAGGIHLITERGERTLGWGSVRGRFDVVVTDRPSRRSRAATFIRTAVVVGGNRIELPWLDVAGADERQAQHRVREHAVEVVARDPRPEEPVRPEGADPERPAVLLMEQFSANGGALVSAVRCFSFIPLLALVAELASLLWDGTGYVLPYLVIPAVVGVIDVCALVYLLVLFAWLYAPTYVVVEPSGVTVRGRQGNGKGQYVLPWDQVRGRLEARAVKATTGWEARVVCRTGGRDVVLTGASLMAEDEWSARLMAHERIALIASYDPGAPLTDEDSHSSISPMRLPSSSR